MSIVMSIVMNIPIKSQPGNDRLFQWIRFELDTLATYMTEYITESYNYEGYFKCTPGQKQTYNTDEKKAYIEWCIEYVKFDNI